MILHIVKRDINLTLRSGQSWWLGLIFFAVFLTLCTLSLEGGAYSISRLAPPLIWLAVILSALLSFTHIFVEDYNDGTLEQLSLSGTSYFEICVAKLLSFSLTALLPLVLATPLAALAFNLSQDTVIRLMLSLFTAIPAIAAYGVFASALTVTRKAGGLLIVLITVPFLIPVLIFGVAAVDANSFGSTVRALLGLSLIGCAVSLPASASALKTAYE